jgi:hypothetical protein
MNTPPSLRQIIKRLVRLNLARQDFLGSKTLAERLVTNPVDPRDMMFRPLMAGIVVTYARAFRGNEGIGLLDDAFAKFPDATLTEIHKKLLQFRDKLYAHRDALDANVFTRHPSNSADLYQLQIRFDDGGNFSCCSNAPEVNPEHLPTIVKLCDLQAAKVNRAVVELLPHLTKGRKFKPGTYTIEELCAEP